MNKKLNVYGKNYTSQHGEDGIIEYILSKCEVPKVCVDIGAWDGKNLSNVYTLWHDKGWHGILVEAEKSREENIKKEYAGYNINSFNALVAGKGENSIDDLFIKNKLPGNVGVISIDIDSYDYYVWKNLNYVNPSIVIIEHNHTIPAYIDYHDPEGEVFLCCSAKALENLGFEKGYRLICCTLTNSIFIKNDLFHPDAFPDMNAEGLFDYSSCAGLRLSGFTGRSCSKYADVYFGDVAGRDRIISKIRKMIFTLMGKRNSIPAKVIDAYSSAGITII